MLVFELTRAIYTESENILIKSCRVGEKPTSANLDVNGFYFKFHFLVVFHPILQKLTFYSESVLPFLGAGK
jgi:hypothetical protein